MTVIATSSNTNLVPNENLTLYNIDDTTQALTIIPVDGQSGTSTITISVDNGVNSTSTTFLLTVNPPGGGTDVFANTNNIVIPSFGVATPYPSTINVSGEVGTITNVAVTLHGMSHSNPGDVNVLLAGRTWRADCGAHVRHGGEQSHDRPHVYVLGSGVY